MSLMYRSIQKSIACLILHVTIFVICLIPKVNSQNTNSDEIRPFFFSVIVQNMDSSVDWYSRMLGFDVVNRIDLEERGLKQVNLEMNGAQLELIELTSALSPKELLPSNTNKARIQGFFKVGFSVDSISEWVSRLENLGAVIHGDIVTDPVSGNKMVILTDPDGNRIQLFER